MNFIYLFTLAFKSLGSVRFFLFYFKKKRIPLFNKSELLKSDSKDIYTIKVYKDLTLQTFRNHTDPKLLNAIAYICVDVYKCTF